MKNITSKLLIVIIVLIQSCKKESYTLSGNVLIDCNTPMSNTELQFFRKSGGFTTGELVLGSTTTDANGNFTFTYKSNKSGEIWVSAKDGNIAGNKIMEGISMGVSSSALNTVVKASSFLNIKLGVTNALSSNDTFFFIFLKNILLLAHL